MHGKAIRKLPANTVWDEMRCVLTARVLKYHTDSYVKNDFEVFTKRGEKLLSQSFQGQW